MMSSSTLSESPSAPGRLDELQTDNAGTRLTSDRLHSSRTGSHEIDYNMNHVYCSSHRGSEVHRTNQSPSCLLHTCIVQYEWG